MNINSKRIIIFLASIVLFTGCFDYDPFGFAHKNLPGKYSLERTDSDDYYLHKSDTGFLEFQTKTPLGGAIKKLGWSEKHLLVNVSHYRKTFNWYVVDLETDSISGPLMRSDSSAYPELRKINVYPASEVWVRWW